jgi:hypothetical protein
VGSDLEEQRKMMSTYNKQENDIEKNLNSLKEECKDNEWPEYKLRVWAALVVSDVDD